jgi:CO/xanthine dehydrogenase FAD-binding subunit
MHSFDYRRAATLQEALDAVSSAKGTSVFMAGGTDLLVKIKKGITEPRCVVDVKGIPGLNGFSISKDQFTIGALTTMRTLETSPEVSRIAPLLAQAAGRLGSVQVRNKATLGGNLCNAAPSAETAPALLALDAQAEILARDGRRVIDLRQFFTGPGSTVLTQGEILTSLMIPLNDRSRQGSVYYKLSIRKAMDIAFVGVAVLLEIDRDERIRKARIGLGAVAPTPIRAIEAEKILLGRVLDQEAILESSQSAAKCCSPISDLRASADYRREMVNRLCRRGLLEAYVQAQSLNNPRSD